MTKNEKMVVLRSIITMFVSKEMPFTSVEVTNHVKRLGIWIPNRQVAEYLRENVVEIADEYGLEYRISTIRVDTNKRYQTANCYHVSTFDVNAYLARDIRAITPDEFEAMHGMEAVVSPDEEIKKTEIFVNDSGRLEFNFPGAK